MEVVKTDIQAALQKFPVFSALNEVELRKIAFLTEEKEYEAGTNVFHEGSPAEGLLVLEDGKIALQMSLKTPDTQNLRRVTVDVAGPGELIGWSALFEPHVYTLTAVCLQRTRVLSINGVKLRSLLSTNHHIGYVLLNELIKVVAQRLDDTREVLISERTQSA